MRVTTLRTGSDAQAGRHLITESGTFQTEQGLVRDFTEVGYDRIHETYSFVADRLLNHHRK
jgi:predicted ATPase